MRPRDAFRACRLTLAGQADRGDLVDHRSLWLEGAVAALSVTVAVGVGRFLHHFLRLPNLSMIFLAAVLFCAVRFGARTAIIASFLAFLAYNFFFVEPLYTFAISELHEVLSLLVFLAVAVFTGSLAGRARDRSAADARNAALTESLYNFSRQLTGASAENDVLQIAAAHLHATLARPVVLLTARGEEISSLAASPADAKLNADETRAALMAMQNAETPATTTAIASSARFRFRPLRTARGAVGVCALGPPAREAPMSPDNERALDAILDQSAIAIERAVLAREALRAAALEENEKVRDALLASLSHDLRTPLAGIAGAASSLRALGDKMSAEDREDLLASIEEETGRLTRFVANLLDMSRIEAGGMKVRRDRVNVDDVVQSAIERCRRAFPKSSIRASLAQDLPAVSGDARLLEQVLFNLLDNAQKYGGEGQTTVHARREGGNLTLSVTDEGPGVKPADLERIFEKFYRGGRMDGRKAGTGLGLSICKGLIEAMGGDIVAQSPAARRRGMRIVIRLPADESAPDQA